MTLVDWAPILASALAPKAKRGLTLSKAIKRCVKEAGKTHAVSKSELTAEFKAYISSRKRYDVCNGVLRNACCTVGKIFRNGAALEAMP